jgi:PKD repeat protein
MPPGSPVAGPAPFTVNFDGSKSNNPGGSIVSWKLDFGDGSAVAKGKGTPPAKVTHTYSSIGSFPALLSLKTSQGTKSSARLMVFATDPNPPRATWLTGTPINGFAPQIVDFNASQSAPGDWSIDFGDGTAPVTGTGTPPASLPHTYTDPANYAATLTITADGKVTTATARSSIVVPSLPQARTRAPARITDTTATLEGHILPNASTAQYWFEWGTSPSLGNSTAKVDLTDVATVDTEITGLDPSSQYYFRIVASNVVGENDGPVLSFTTNAGP